MKNEKERIKEYIELCIETEQAIRNCEKTVGGVEGYAVKADVFTEISEELGLLDEDIVDPDEKRDDLRAAMYRLMAWSGRWFNVLDNPKAIRFVEIDGKPHLFFEKGVFQDCYGETDLERMLTSLALRHREYPLSEYVRCQAEHIGVELREEYISKVDRVTLEQFDGCAEIPKISSSLLPGCLQGEGLKVLSIGLTGCAPCKVVDKAFDVLEDELEDVEFSKRTMGKEQDICGVIKDFGIFAAPTLLFSDGENILVHSGGTMDLEIQIKYIRSVVKAMDEVRYDPFIRRAELSLDFGVSTFEMRVIE